MIPYFSHITIIIEDKFTQTRQFISYPEFREDLDMYHAEMKKEREIPKYKSSYKRKYDMYNCMVENTPFTKNIKTYEVGEVFYYQPFDYARHYKFEILNIQLP
jgi:hypothetical protein